ncbi:hypothetical protein JCM16303_003557 [Sporobolomyces ruberrimus]
MKFPLASASGSGSKGSFAFALSNLVANKVERSVSGLSGLAAPPASQLQARLSRLAGSWTASGRIDARGQEVDKDWLITRCPLNGMARLDRQGRCFCGTLADTESTLCEGFDENDRTTVCVEDLRDRDQVAYDLDTTPRRRKAATCGLEFIVEFEPTSCPVGYTRIGQDSEGGEDHFICQDSASPYSCGPRQVDCYAREGVLQTQCKDQICEPLMCKEGWRFRLMQDEGGAQDGATYATCVRSKPLFFNSDPASRF